MDFTKEVIEKIQSLSVPHEMEYGGNRYVDKALNLVKPPLHEAHQVSTLQGLIDLTEILHKNFQKEGLMCLIQDHLHVSVFTETYGTCRRKECLIDAQGDVPNKFQFGFFLPPDEFCIGLLSKFVHEVPLETLYSLANNLTSESIRQDEDTGIGQRVIKKSGVATREEVVVQAHHLLRPFRTFADVAQPASRFLFRIRMEKDQPPKCALFEADGGAWIVAAKATIKAWLEARLSDRVKVVA